MVCFRGYLISVVWRFQFIPVLKQDTILILSQGRSGCKITYRREKSDHYDLPFWKEDAKTASSSMNIINGHEIIPCRCVKGKYVKCQSEFFRLLF